MWSGQCAVCSAFAGLRGGLTEEGNAVVIHFGLVIKADL
jgi:hypothetical protein